MLQGTGSSLIYPDYPSPLLIQWDCKGYDEDCIRLHLKICISEFRSTAIVFFNINTVRCDIHIGIEWLVTLCIPLYFSRAHIEHFGISNSRINSNCTDTTRRQPYTYTYSIWSMIKSSVLSDSQRSVSLCTPYTDMNMFYVK